ncbi:TetR family transcriptional regulator [Frondihabitans sp. PhB188]|uniref:TetR/AcrR family transcriptional regulator n=1 Tax=Frondihabitans sp. PhB188 TaxID=2485200 RepID=UPI000FAD1754|nr:TetR/AcrR family transcriptional regulator [Frondihabitans sp. PhB188]ROQ41225.1 TetR family transcriptional regulator [Frondihabitans sp. PhB188]
MLVTETNEALPGGSSLLRNEPVQARSSARLTGLLDAAAAIIDEIGFERLTTAMVAERAGASIGTVYRYFPDRIAVVEALAARCVGRLMERIDGVIVESGSQEWHDAVDFAIDAQVDMYRTEPGFRAIRFGDAEVADSTSGETEGRRPFAEQMSALLAVRYPVERSADLDFALDVAIEMGSAILARAFQASPEGDSRFIEECRSVVTGYLAGA